jgi:hypothetical protein
MEYEIFPTKHDHEVFEVLIHQKVKLHKPKRREQRQGTIEKVKLHLNL